MLNINQIAFPIMLVMAIILIGPLETHSEILPELKADEVYVAFFSLPDGEATLIQKADKKNILINTGSTKSEDSLLFQLEELQIKEIDKLILTNQSIDYCGNSKRLIERYTINNVIYAGQLSNACKEQISQIKLSQWKTNEQQSLGDHLFFNVLQADQSGKMTLDINYGKNSLLFLSSGDVEDEKKLLSPSLDPKIIKIGDYARGKSPSEAFLSTIDPHLSIVFNCEKCSINEGLIERLNESWIDVYQLEHIGTTILKINLNDYEIMS